jgi:hypothetical protein
LAVLGKVPGTTSWELLGLHGAQGVGTVLTLIYGAPLFANAANFRTPAARQRSLERMHRKQAVVLTRRP